jgi:hypothetical protein
MFALDLKWMVVKSLQPDLVIMYEYLYCVLSKKQDCILFKMLHLKSGFKY